MSTTAGISALKFLHGIGRQRSFGPRILTQCMGKFLHTKQGEHQTMQHVKERLVEHMGVSQGYKPLQMQRSHLLDMLPCSQSELPIRAPSDSFDSAIIPLSSSPSLQEKYITFLGHVRTGRLMEDMDLFAVWVAHRHILNPRQKEGMPTPYVLVTVLVDQINFEDIIPKPDCDIRLSGHVSWVGRSSIEITVWLEQEHIGTWQRLTRATFLMAARDPTGHGPAIVNALEPVTPEEKARYNYGEMNKKRRTAVQRASLLKTGPSAEEQAIIHELFLQTVDPKDTTFHRRIVPMHAMWMEEATLTNIVFCHPEDRNLHNKVFGGFLMRQALELSWAAGYLYSKFRPKLCHISDIGFHKPVDVGSLLRLKAFVNYTESNYLQIVCHAEVFDPRTGQHNTTNQFHYTYETPDQVPKLYPKTYDEAMMYLDGRRHFQHVMGLSGK
ncbi:acyl-coenzyme A thioesterase 9, mitochondrial-like [Cloeon dipterum]|uniref:acyl-coenzyme A thioesterase 9, mitochondrial-like n=1 Tax=Cloeon dipterum TaxID=197152 RepID=UPI00321F65C3